MREKVLRSILLSIVFILLTSHLATAEEWDKLGQWNVKRTKKLAIISVTSETPYKAIKLNIGSVGIYIRNISVFFTDGEKYVSTINKSISPNKDTQYLCFPENEKAIRSVRFSYNSNKRSIITLWASTDSCNTESSSSERKPGTDSKTEFAD